MRFSNFLFFAAAAIAAPTADLEPRNLVARADAKGLEPRQRSNTAVGVIASSLSTLDASVSSNLGSIQYVVTELRGNVAATLRVQLEATLEANYRAIANALAQASRDIANVTVNAAGGIGGSVLGLTADAIASLTASIYILIRILANIRVVLTIAYTDLNAALFALVEDEVTAIRQLIAPLLRPIVTFLVAARQFALSVGISVQGLDGAVSGLLEITAQLGAVVGLDLLPGSGPGAVAGIGSIRG